MEPTRHETKIKNMELKIEDNFIRFELVPLIFQQKNLSGIFFNKNNKSLKETLQHRRYVKFHNLFLNKYNDRLDQGLGDFLKHLKESNDQNYLTFLNSYGDHKFCEFKIEKNLNDKGIYCFIQDDEIKYIGRCNDSFGKRVNQGYGKIHPKNCFIDGQTTNCHINSLVNSTENTKFGIYIMNNKSREEISNLEKLILTNYKFEWNIQNQKNR
jgi:hypothetical protein